MRLDEFSERYQLGAHPIVETIEFVSDEIKNLIWDILYDLITTKASSPHARDFHLILRNTLARYVGITLDIIALHNSHSLMQLIKTKFFLLEGSTFYSMLNYISFIMKEEDFTALLNDILKDKAAPCRFAGYKLTLVTDKAEVESISTAMNTPYRTVNHLIEKANSCLLASDYPGCCESAIKAVEGLAKSILLIEHEKFKHLIDKLIDSKEITDIDGSLKQSMKSCWGFASQRARHASSENSYKEPTPNEAKFILVYSTAFINLVNDACTKKPSLLSSDKDSLSITTAN